MTILKLTFPLLFTASGFAIICLNSNFWVALGVLLLVYGNNIGLEMREKK